MADHHLTFEFQPVKNNKSAVIFEHLTFATIFQCNITTQFVEIGESKMEKLFELDFR